MDPQTIEGLLNVSPFLIAGPALIGIGQYLKKIIKRDKNKIENIKTSLVERIWKNTYLPLLARNIVMTKSAVDDYVGTGFDISRIGYAFNPYGKLLVNYIENRPEEKRSLRKELTDLVSKYSKELC